jgi:recombination protein RecT
MSNAVAQITQDIYGTRDSFSSVLTDRSLNFEREAEFAIQSITANDYSTKLAASNRQSVINAVTNIAAIGISLNPAKKQAYLVPRDNKICLDISYIGLMDLAMATGAIRWAQAELVYSGDSFSLNGFDKPPTHSYAPFSKDRGEVIGVYVVVKTDSGDYLTETMSIDDVNKIRDRSSAWKAYVDKGKSCPWVTDPGEMAKKTCVKRAYKFWPKTERLEQAIHHLNTDGGEGINFNAQPQHDDDMAKRWVEQVIKQESQEGLQQTWQAALADAQKTKNMQAYNVIKTAVIKRKAELEAAEKQTIEGQTA